MVVRDAAAQTVEKKGAHLDDMWISNKSFSKNRKKKEERLRRPYNVRINEPLDEHGQISHILQALEAYSQEQMLEIEANQLTELVRFEYASSRP